MSFKGHHLRFSVELSSKAGHESIVSHIEGELKHLEHVREYLIKRAKVELEYGSALARISSAAARAISDNDKESPIRKAWCSYIAESETKAKLITEFTNILNSTTLKRLEQLIEDKRSLLRKYNQERFRVDSSYKQESAEINRLKKTYQDNAKESESGKRKYEEVLSKDKFNSKERERAKDRYVKTTLKLHQNHNDYVLALKSGNCYQGLYNKVLVPTMLNSLQYLQEEYVGEWKDLLQEVVLLTMCCREEYLISSQIVQTGIDEVKKEQEYSGFITKHRQHQSPVLSFIFDESLLELTSTGLTADELVVNDLTMEKLQHKRTLLSNDLENVQQQLEDKQREFDQENSRLLADKQESDEHFSILQKELSVSILHWHVDDLKGNNEKFKETTTLIGTALDKLGNGQPQKFADLSSPAPPGEYGQSTPEIRRSARKMPSLFRKKKLERELTSKPDGKHPSKRRTQKVNGIPKENDYDDDDDDAVGEYFEPNEEIPLQEEAWFHGTIDRKNVPALLKKDGDYLVRESSTKPGQFVLSTLFDGAVKHFIIQSSDDGLFRFEDQGFPSVRQLLAYHVDNRVPLTMKSKAIVVIPVLKQKDKWELSRDNIVFEQKKLGQGHFGDVMKGILKPGNVAVAVKSCKQNVSQVVKVKFLAEAEILKQYDHPNIVKLIGVCAEKEPVFIVMEFMPGGDFLSYLRKKGAQLNSKKLLRFSIDAAAGMEYLESKNCIHRDLAARNCLISSDDSTLKISDFGMSREVEEVYEASNMKEIPVKWTAPEALNYYQYTTLSDIWSFGILLWETFSYGNTPYPGLNNRETRDKVETGYRMPPPTDTPPAVYQIMKDSWNIKPEERPRFSEILRRLKQIQGLI